MKKLILAIDFDGTCVTHDYPEVGKDIGAAPVLKKLIEHGHRLMLWTMRGNKPGAETLNDAVKWFKDNDIELWGINENPEQQATGWSLSHKQYANIYVDDAAVGCPLLFNKEFHNKPYVDWVAVDKYFESIGLYIKEEENENNQMGDSK
jgi:hypothetical protein